MEQQFVEKIAPIRWFWCFVNNLEKFNDKSGLYFDLASKLEQVQDHPILSSLLVLIPTISKFFEEHNKFPSVDWLALNFKGNVTITKSDDKFSMDMYDSLIEYIDRALLIQKTSSLLLEKDNPTKEDFREIAKDMLSYSDKSEGMPKATKEKLINSYDEYSADYKGLKTHIKPLDDVIGALGYRSVSVFAAPSGHGKSTFAMSVAYYAALSGLCVDYLSFEIPQNHAWFNFVSMESEGTSTPLLSSDMKENLLSDDQKNFYKDHMRSMLQKIKDTGGYLNVLDQTTTSVDTFEGLCAKLETLAEERNRPADLIVVDNIDNFQILKSSERDESTKINNYIVSLDSYSKKYCNGAGTTILLLSQVNRPALKKLHSAEGEDKEKSAKIDVTCIQKYNALYEKATCVLVGYADEGMRAINTMHIYPVKLRNRGVPTKPVSVKVLYAHSKILGQFEVEKTFGNSEERKQAAQNFEEEHMDEILNVTEADELSQMLNLD